MKRTWDKFSKRPFKVTSMDHHQTPGRVRKNRSFHSLRKLASLKLPGAELATIKDETIDSRPLSCKKFAYRYNH